MAPAWARWPSSFSTSRSSPTRSTGPSCSARSWSCCCSALPADWVAPSSCSGAGSGGRGVLEVRDLTKAFDGFVAVSRVSFDVAKGSVCAIIGPNGAGKTTLFNLITGHLRCDAGRVSLNGRDVTGVPPHELCRLGVGRSFQRTNIFAKLTVFENVQAAFLSHRGRLLHRAEDHRAAPGPRDRRRLAGRRARGRRGAARLSRRAPVRHQSSWGAPTRPPTPPIARTRPGAAVARLGVATR